MFWAITFLLYWKEGSIIFCTPYKFTAENCFGWKVKVEKVNRSPMKSGSRTIHLCKRCIVLLSMYLVLYIFLLLLSLTFSFWRVKVNSQLCFQNWLIFFFMVCFMISIIWNIFYLNKYQIGKIVTFIPYFSSLLITPNNFVLLLIIFKALGVLIWKVYRSTAIIADHSSKTWSIFFYELSLQSILIDTNSYAAIFIGSNYTWTFYNKSTLVI